MIKKALIAGDRRRIIFLGKCPQLEADLYSGRIRNEDELKARARGLGASLQVLDGKKKVWRQEGILVGEVTEISSDLEKRRRIYLAPGSYVMVDINGSMAKIIGEGCMSCLILGNKFTQTLANEAIQRAQCQVNDQLVRSIFEEASRRTASVSQEYDLLSTDLNCSIRAEVLLDKLNEDCQKNGWRLCDQL
ncbi:MAG: DUF2121 domain-containing protein [Methanotrichaceae archaeon]|nr:DUF2121 domain-containing protein [Methanotrichaceae archaeon]